MNVPTFRIETGEVRSSFSKFNDLAEARTTCPGFPFAFPETAEYRQRLCCDFFAFVPEPKNRTRPAEPLPESKGRDMGDCDQAGIEEAWLSTPAR
jgi:hypothetical protein